MKMSVRSIKMGPQQFGCLLKNGVNRGSTVQNYSSGDCNCTWALTPYGPSGPSTTKVYILPAV